MFYHYRYTPSIHTNADTSTEFEVQISTDMSQHFHNDTDTCLQILTNNNTVNLYCYRYIKNIVKSKIYYIDTRVTG